MFLVTNTKTPTDYKTQETASIKNIQYLINI